MLEQLKKESNIEQKNQLITMLTNERERLNKEVKDLLQKVDELEYKIVNREDHDFVQIQNLKEEVKLQKEQIQRF